MGSESGEEPKRAAGLKTWTVTALETIGHEYQVEAATKEEAEEKALEGCFDCQQEDMQREFEIQAITEVVNEGQSTSA